MVGVYIIICPSHKIAICKGQMRAETPFQQEKERWLKLPVQTQVGLFGEIEVIRNMRSRRK